MRDARRFNDRITIGCVPDTEDLEQLRETGYKTLIDLREEDEKFGGKVQKKATNMGFRYLAIPIRRDGIKMEDVSQFYEAIYERGSAPIYTFSRRGRKPLAFLLLFEGVAKGESHLIPNLIKKAAKFGINLEGDSVLQEFLVEFLNSGQLKPIVDTIREHRPDLLM